MGSDSGTLLCIAAFYGYTAIVRELLSRPGIDVNLAHKTGAAPLCAAAQYGHEEIERSLLAVRNIKIDVRKDDGATALFCAAQENFPRVVELLIKRGANVNLSLNDGTSPLCIAAQQGNVAG